MSDIDRAKRILGVTYTPHEMCVKCALRHMEQKGSFDVKCQPLPANLPDPEDARTDEEFMMYVIDSPVHFSKYVLGLKLRKFQEEILLCTSKRKVLRISRRAGKTWAMAIMALYKAFVEPNYTVLIAAPYDAQVKNIFDIINQFVQGSELLLESVQKFGPKHVVYKSDPYEIRFGNGSRIIGFTTGSKGAENIRGQGADLLIFDEVDYMSEDAIQAILAILASNPKNSELVAASTPKGTRSFFYEWCHSPHFREFHYRYQDIEHYDPERDEEFKKQLGKEEYEREILAEFTLQESGVFANVYIDRALRDYEYDTPPYEDGVYYIGVDWNETVTGVHIVVLRYINRLTPGLMSRGFSENDIGKYFVSNHIEIPPSEFTQMNAVERIVALNETYQPKAIYVDTGFGVTQIQMLKAIGASNPRSKLLERLKGVDFASTVELRDSVTGSSVKQSTKSLMVSVLARALEAGNIILPASEDYKTKLVGQMRSYSVVGFSPSGQPKFSKGNDHILDALMLAFYAAWERGSPLLNIVPAGGPAKPASAQRIDEPVLPRSAGGRGPAPRIGPREFDGRRTRWTGVGARGVYKRW